MSRRIKVIRWDEKPRTTSSFNRPRGEIEPLQKARRKMVPLSKKEITCLKAVNDLSQRGFGKIKRRDIARVATRVYPEFYRMALNENEILDCLEKLRGIGHVSGYGHARFENQSFLITGAGKDALRNFDQAPIVEQPPLEQRASHPTWRMMSRSVASSRQRRVQTTEYDLSDLTREDECILQVIDKLKNVRCMSKVLHNDVWRMMQRECASFVMEGTLLSKLNSLIKRRYLKWAGHYVLTDKGQRAATEICDRNWE